MLPRRLWFCEQAKNCRKSPAAAGGCGDESERQIALQAKRNLMPVKATD
jgi:hypothetical protein